MDANEHRPLAAEGGCLCGQVRFRLLDRLPPVGFCHCSQCRRASGTGSNAVLNVRQDRFEWVGGEGELRRFETATGWSHTFCGRCGCPMPQPTPDGGRMFVPAGALDGKPDLRIAGHIFVGDKPDWVMICDDSPRFERHADGSG
jgi:hypothetical protein